MCGRNNLYVPALRKRGKPGVRFRTRHDNRWFVGVQRNKGDLCASSQTRYIGIARQAKYGTIVIHKTKCNVSLGSAGRKWLRTSILCGTKKR